MPLKLLYTFTLTGLMLMFSASTARAQQSNMPVVKEKGIIQTNPFAVRTAGMSGTINLFAGYDTNINYGSNDTTSIYEESIGGLAFMLAPAIRFNTSGLSKRFGAEEKLSYGIEAQLLYRQYYNNSTVDNIFNEPRFGAVLAGELYYNPSRHFKLQLFEKGTRYSEPHYLFRDNYTQTWYQNTMGLGMLIIPGGGLLEIVARYELSLDIFEDSSLQAGNRMKNSAGLRAQYKFLPFSFVWLAATYDFVTYLSSSGRDSMPLKLYGGISTPITKNLGLTLGGGYGWGFYSAGPSPATWLALASVTYTLVNRLKLSFNYGHTFEDSVLGNYSDEQNFGLTAYYQHSRNLLLQASAGFRYVNFYNIYYGAGGTGDGIRTDTIFYTHLDGKYKVAKNIALGLSYRFMLDSTPFRLTTANQTQYPDHQLSIVNNPSFVKHEIFFTGTYYF